MPVAGRPQRVKANPVPGCRESLKTFMFVDVLESVSNDTFKESLIKSWRCYSCWKQGNMISESVLRCEAPSHRSRSSEAAVHETVELFRYRL